MGNKHSLNGFYDTFNNCRETGLILCVYDDNARLYIWACECRNFNQIMIVLGSEDNKDSYNMFDDEAYKKAKYFDAGDYNSAVNFVYKQIKFMFNNSLKKEQQFKFNIYQSLTDLKKIQEDASMLDYDNYYELASFYDESESYSCDLIIKNGKMGLQYNTYDKNNAYWKKLTFEESNINLENETTIMLDMKNKLDKFIFDELEYSIEMDNDIKI